MVATLAATETGAIVLGTRWYAITVNGGKA
jgi:hypothetical protein